MVEGNQLPDPVVVDFVLCEGVARDLSTGKLSLLGLMGAVKEARELPARVTFAAFVRLTNVRESIALHFRIVDAEEEILVQTLEAELAKPADIMFNVVSVVHFPDVEFPRYGVYFVELWRSGRYVVEKKLTVTAPEENDDD